MIRVKVNAKYRYNPAPLDQYQPPHGVRCGLLAPGDVVRVVNLPRCPKANVMGHCHIQHPVNGTLLGLVCIGSLEKITSK